MVGLPGFVQRFGIGGQQFPGFLQRQGHLFRVLAAGQLLLDQGQFRLQLLQKRFIRQQLFQVGQELFSFLLCSSKLLPPGYLLRQGGGDVQDPGAD